MCVYLRQTFGDLESFSLFIFFFFSVTRQSVCVVYLEWPKDREIRWRCIKLDACPKRVKRWGKSPVNRERIYVVDPDVPPIESNFSNFRFKKFRQALLFFFFFDQCECTLWPFLWAILLCAVGNSRRFHSICSRRRNYGQRGRWRAVFRSGN